uniref:protein BANP isoform X1 n=1 Tax=Arvicanthis niloticus TaxID=61156 RepID=UPI001486DBDA|nr:protein BANP isoform X1 [Arvicanthis niloticus]XP_034378152.1 protein BANP isoform X1 [Arvicanthis niloticus]XP_034378153.1 protein BANP isoform X1 [Arvicanthis niloticus]XP_034378154.1 protein BANP isoform X1 [Arvicanthis niloticus]XP_034378155.1 protein BANP isoform X1 [Arvicanthis niloticus]
MMSEQDLADVVQIAVEDLSPDHPVVLENHVVTDDDEPALKRQRLEINCQDPSIKSFLYSINQTICLRLDSIEAKLQALEATCKSLEEKLDLVTNKQHSPIQVPMVAGSPLGATQTCNKVRCVVPQTTVILNNDRQNAIVAKMEDPLSNRAPDSLENIVSNAVPGRRQNTIVVKVPGQDDSHNEDGESGSEASDSVSNCGQPGSQNIGSNVTLITLNSEEDYPNGTWLGDENNPEMRVRCAIIPSDMLHISTNCRTAEKMALTLLDYLFHREVQAVSNLSGQGKHGKKQLDPLTIYGIRCHLFYKFGITESDWYRIKQSIDSKCRTAWRRKQRGQSLAVKSFSRRTPSSSSYSASETMMGTPPPTSELQQSQPQALHYALANAQQVQIHQIGEDGQVQVIPQGHLHIAQVPQGEQVQITQDSEGNLQIHHVGQDGQSWGLCQNPIPVSGDSVAQANPSQLWPLGGDTLDLPAGNEMIQVLQGAQLIAVASSDPAATGVDGSPLQGSDIQVQYVQLAPVSDHTAAAQTAETLQPTLQPEMQLEHGAIQIQ